MTWVLLSRLADKLSSEAWSTIAIAAASALSFGVGELWRIRRERSAIVQSMREREKRATSVTLVVDDMLLPHVRSVLKEAANEHLGLIRRQFAEELSDLTRAVRTHMGEASKDRESGYTLLMADKLLKEEMRAEIVATRKALTSIEAGYAEVADQLSRIGEETIKVEADE